MGNKEFLQSNEMAEAFENACWQFPSSPEDAAKQFVEAVASLLSDSNSDSSRYQEILRTARTYDYVDSFAHLGNRASV